MDQNYRDLALRQLVVLFGPESEANSEVDPEKLRVLLDTIIAASVQHVAQHLMDQMIDKVLSQMPQPEQPVEDDDSGKYLLASQFMRSILTCSPHDRPDVETAVQDSMRYAEGFVAALPSEA